MWRCDKGRWGALALMILTVLPAQAQQPLTVQIETNWPEATVYADTARLGPALRGAFVVPAATREIRLVPPGDDAWSILPVAATLDAAPGDTLVLDLVFPYHYRVESLPFGATVLLEDVEGRHVLGETPLLFKTDVPPAGQFVVEARGYVPERVDPDAEIWNRYLLTLAPLTDTEAAPAAQMDWRPPRRPRRWIDYTAAAVALGAGVLAVHYKFKGDRLDDRYRDTGDPVLRDRIRSYDTRSYLALGAMQAGITVLAVRLVLK